VAFLRHDLYIDFSYRESFFFTIAGAVLSIWSLFFIGRTFGNLALRTEVGVNYFLFALIGVAFSIPLRAGISGVSRRVRELQLFGGLEMLVAAPIPSSITILMLAAYPIFSAVLRCALVLGLGMVLFGARFELSGAVAALAVLGLGIIVSLALGICSAAFVIVFKRGDPIAWLIDVLTFLVSGIFYPVEVLPPVLRAVASLVPATHALSALRNALLRGAGVSEIMQQLIVLALFAVLILPASTLILRWALHRAARDGTLGQA
jgi:ABC-2 type transport system permease protein